MSVTLKQIKTTDEQHLFLRQCAKTSATTVLATLNDAIEEFLDAREKREGLYREYLNSPRDGKLRSYWINESVLRRLRKYSEIDKTSQNRILYTAIYFFCEKQALTID